MIETCWFLQPEVPQASSAGASSAPVLLALPACQPIPAPPDLAPVAAVALAEPCVVVASSLPTSPAAVDNQLCISETTLWRTIRATAGQHSNVHHLLVSGMSKWDAVSSGPVSGSVSALFRPWSSFNQLSFFA